MMAASFVNVLIQLLTQLPVYAVMLVGAIVAVVRWQRHPQVSLLAVIGLAVLFVDSLAGRVLNAALPMMVVSRAMGGNSTRVGSMFGVCNIVSAVVGAVGYGLLLAAVFKGRAPQPAVEKESES